VPQLVEPGGEGLALLGAQLVETVVSVDPAPIGSTPTGAGGRAPTG
jgi:hypothetical protein